MAIADLFKTPPANTPANTPPGNNTLPGNNIPPGNNTPNGDPAPNNQNTPNNQTPKNPLDVYADVFNNSNKGKEVTAPSFKLDSKVIGDVASKLDFTKGISPEVLTKAQQGDATALMDLISTVGRNAYSTSLEHLTSLTDAHLASRSEYENSRINSGVRDHLTSAALSDAPNYNHPVVKQELNRIAAQFAQSPSFADATPQQIAEAAKKYLTDLHSALNPADPAANKSPKDVELDWSKYLTDDSSKI